MQDNQNAIVLTSDYFLSTEISALENTVVEAARRTVEHDTRGITLTDTEREAAITVQVLKELNSVDLATLLLRYKYVKKIRDGNLVTRHPGQYASLTEMAVDQGISVTELSRIVDLVEIIFPFLANRLGLDIPTLWKDIGKSNFSELIPVLKVLVTGQNATHSDQANQAAARFLDDAAAGYVAQGIDVPTNDALREEVVRDIVERGTLLNNRELRTHLRPERTPSIQMYHFADNGGPGFVVANLTNDQLTMLLRRAGSCVDCSTYTRADMPNIIRLIGIA